MTIAEDVPFPEGPTAYTDFPWEERTPRPGGIEIDLVEGDAELPKGRPSFDSGSPWRYDARPDGYSFSFEAGLPPEPFLTVTADARTDRVTVRSPRPSPALLGYPLDQLLLMNHLALRSGAIVHGAGLELGGAGLVFAGVSKAGKSTLTELFRAGAPDAVLLSDDRMVVRRTARDWDAWGTPWPGTSGVAANRRTTLRAVLLLEKASRHEVVPLAPAAAARRLLPALMCPWYEGTLATAVLETLDALVSSVPFFELRFARDAGVVDVVRELVASSSL